MLRKVMVLVLCLAAGSLMAAPMPLKVALAPMTQFLANEKHSKALNKIATDLLASHGAYLFPAERVAEVMQMYVDPLAPANGDFLRQGGELLGADVVVHLHLIETDSFQAWSWRGEESQERLTLQAVAYSCRDGRFIYSRQGRLTVPTGDGLYGGSRRAARNRAYARLIGQLVGPLCDQLGLPLIPKKKKP